MPIVRTVARLSSWRMAATRPSTSSWMAARIPRVMERVKDEKTTAYRPAPAGHRLERDRTAPSHGTGAAPAPLC